LQAADDRFSSRLPFHESVNALTHLVRRLAASGAPIVDLTESNPTRVGLDYPATLLEPLSRPAALTYQPDALGLRSAREAIAGEFRRRGVAVDPDHLVLSASTSEAYSWLFKLLCDPGDVVLIPQPSYPLFEYLTRLEGVETRPYRLSYHGRWEIDLHSLADAPERTRAVLAVSPNNPTGSFLSAREVEALMRMCERRGWALIVDEVFADYALEATAPITDLAARADVLTFSLGGASKAIGLPQVKLGWTLVGGPAPARDAALARMEVIADTFLSVGTPVLVAAPALLESGAAVRASIDRRVRQNLQAAHRIVAAHPACTLLPVEGGWSAIIRVPASRDEETLVLELLEQAHVLVHPGYFFDMPHEAFLVISLLPDNNRFHDALRRALLFVNS
jgi:aspartate/methionine/tyrosine aminotransferase